MLTVAGVKNAFEKLGIENGDTVIVHSSFKSMGEIENGAETVIKGIQQAIGDEGTLVFPTLCGEDWEHVYENWHMDAKSDVGYLTNYFRKLPGALRSNQATHSVAAIGKHAEYITCTHGETGKRYGIFGDTPFSADSPWEKMYELNTKIVFLGVSTMKCTFRHYVEYVYMDKYLKSVENTPDYERLKRQVFTYDRWSEGGVWLNFLNSAVTDRMDKKGLVNYSKCGDADVTMFTAKDFVDECTKIMEEKDWSSLWTVLDTCTVEGFVKWLGEVEEAAKK